MKFALAQTNPTIGAFSENIQKICNFSEQAKKNGADVVIFPELSICGYPPKDLLERQEFIEDSIKALWELIDKIKGITVICGGISKNNSDVGRPIFNSIFVFKDGKILQRGDKRLLPTYDVFDEARYFAPGQRSSWVKIGEKKIGLSVCEDIWNDKDLFPRHLYPVDPVEELFKEKVDLFINISASPFNLGKPKFRKHLLTHLAQKYRRPFFYINQVGGQDSLIFDGNSMAVDHKGELIAHASDFKEDIIFVDIEKLKGETHPTSSCDEEALLKALSIGLFDYMRRTGFKKIVLGLSGGIDSSVTAVIAVKTLGAENVLGVLMPSPFTSKESIEDAMGLAKNLGIKTIKIPITNIFNAYLKELAPVFKGYPTDTTEENIQARIRGNILMAISNKFGHLVISTGNKSELAVGYCTLYGDLSGGFALICDVPKTMVYKLAYFLNREREIIPHRVLIKPPSAELRPNQKDQDELPPYEIVDTVIHMYLELGASPDEIIAKGLDPDLVKRVIRMIDKSEYKRQQAPFGPRVTSRAFGCGRRYPVAHGYKL